MVDKNVHDGKYLFQFTIISRIKIQEQKEIGCGHDLFREFL